jgi:putative flippase GtrA
MNTWQKILNNRVLRFLLSAGAGFLVDMLAFYLLYRYVFVSRQYQVLVFKMGNFTLSLIISFFLGVLVNFLMTKYIVFTESKLAPHKQFIRFISIAIIGFFANLLILELMIKILDVYAPLARVFTALSLFFASYFIHKVFSFNIHNHHEHRTDHK